MALKNSRCALRNLAVLAGMDCAATLGGKLFAALGVPETNIVVLYLFAVLLVARLRMNPTEFRALIPVLPAAPGRKTV